MPSPYGTASTPARGARILIVDDEPLNLQVFDYNFSDEYSLLFAASAAEALEVLRQERVAVVIADHRMPGMLGLDLLALLAKEQPQVVRMLLTAHTDVPLLLDAVNRGVLFRYISKPWDADHMRQDIKHALARHVQDAESQRLMGLSSLVLHGWGTVAAALQGELAGVLRVMDGQTDSVDAARRVRTLHDNARLAAEREQVTSQACEPRPLVDAALASVGGRLRRAEVDVDVDQDGAARIFGVPARLTEALTAVILNAIDSLERRPLPRRLTVRIVVSGEGPVRIVVGDGGAIPAAVVANATQLFFSGRDGAGLGLPVAAAIMTQHGGRLDLSGADRGEVALVLTPWDRTA